MDCASRPLTIYTLGHSNYDMGRFIGLLRAHRIEQVADVRSRPYSKYAPHFSAHALRDALNASGIGYAFYGRELGGLPDNPAYYDAEGYVRYDLIAALPAFAEALSRLLAEAQKARIALVCGEENPSGCHRHLLLARVLKEQGVEVLHLRADGRVQTDEALSQEEAIGEGGQQALFEAAEARPWRSARPRAG